MKKSAYFIFVIFALLLTGCGGPQGAQKELPGITIGIMPDVDSIPFLIAQEKGYFEEEGVHVEIQPFKSAMDRDAALQSGSLDGAVSDVLAVAFAQNGGFDVKAVSSTDGSYRFIAGKSTAASSKSIEDFAGKDVAVSRNTIIEYVTDQILAQAGMSAESINKVIIPQIPTRLEMLENGKLAAATLPEPMASIAVFRGCQYITGSDQLGINPGVMAFTSKSIKNKEASIQAMYRAYNKAVKYLNETPREEYIDFVVEKGGFPADAKEALVLPKYREATLPSESDVTTCVKWMVSKGLIRQSYTFDEIVEDIWSK